MMPSMRTLPHVPTHLRGPALYAAVGLALLALAAWATDALAQAEGLPPAADPGLGALAPLLDGAGPAGVVVAVLVGVWREWRAEAARHAAERERLREDVAALRRELEHLRLDTAHRLERAGDAVAAVRASMESR
jgi:hypothetical protein